MVILVTGANGQLGQALQAEAPQMPHEATWVFCDSQNLNITDVQSIESAFVQHQPNYCINTAAYTAVDKAESESEKAFEVNAHGPLLLAQTCQKYGVTLLHISTDFVFDGQKHTPYTEADKPNPTGVYGASKLLGEQHIQQTWTQHYIVRTSWVYSEFGHNFMKTMLRLAQERPELRVVNDQIGTPTHARELAKALGQMIEVDAQHPAYGLYHYSQEGQCSWYEFACKILEVNGLTTPVIPIATADFPTPAKRPKYSVLDKTNIQRAFQLNINDWADTVFCLPQNS